MADLAREMIVNNVEEGGKRRGGNCGNDLQHIDRVTVNKRKTPLASFGSIAASASDIFLRSRSSHSVTNRLSGKLCKHLRPRPSSFSPEILNREREEAI